MDTRAATEQWLVRALSASRVEVVGDIDRPASGFSAETVIFDALVDGAPRRLVLRKECPGPAVYPTQAPGLDIEVAIQYRAMQAVAAASDVPLAPLVGYEPDPSVLGAPFYVMGFIAGQVPVENPPYLSTGFFVDATPEQRRRMVDDGLRVLARINAVDWRAAGLDCLVPAGDAPSTARQLDLWTDFANRELRGRHHPALEEAVEWLDANQPDERPPSLCWGDARLGNIIWDDFRCACVTDWEAVSIAPSEVDLGWWLMFDRWSHEMAGGARLAGEPTPAEQRARYGELTGRDVGDTFFYEVFAAMRYAAIVVRVMNRGVDRNELPPDQTIWLDNPVTTCLAGYLAERR